MFDANGMFVEQPQDCSDEGERTLSGSLIPPLVMGLPKNTQSICPECKKVVAARQYEKDGKVFMTKECPDHGEFNDIISSDVNIFLEMEKWYFKDGQGCSNPLVTDARNCPSDCGICNMHITHAAIGNIDLTSRCNLGCPTCFASSNKYTAEPSFEEIHLMMKRLREAKPAPCNTIQFIGGEPTLHPDFFKIVKASTELGFTHIQMGTNGIKLADPDFAMQAREAGLQYIYLQMDGVTDDVFEKIRGRKLLETKLKAIESAGKAGLRVILVPTIIRGVNDHQLGDLVKLTFENLDTITGLSMQPISFTGRYAESDRLKQRYTIADIIHDISRQTGLTDPLKDWFSLNSGTPFVSLAEALTGKSVTNYSCHPHCGTFSILFVDKNKKAVPITRFVDLYNLLKDINQLAKKTEKRRIKMFSKLSSLNLLRKHFIAKNAPAGLTFNKFLQTLDGYSDKKFTWNDEYKGHTFKTIFLFCMHFMDNYNYDLQRVRRCAIHYSALDGKMYPFCSYNSGHIHRDRVEREYIENRTL
jgi:7,8-dihydro-6-hydroxymethylpterin dimethyltransferase